MDYSSYFAASQQPFHLMGLPPTPSHTHSGASDDFSNGSPSLDAFEQFQGFDGFPHFATGIVKPPTPTPSAHQPIDVQPAAQLSQRKSSEQTNIDANSDQQQGGSNSDNEDMTPAQSKRKAQNRAAQRAFRERKERHVKDLEAKLANMEESSSNIVAENERLRRDLQRYATENEILKATSAHPSRLSPPVQAGPMKFSPTDFYSEVLEGHGGAAASEKMPMHRISRTESGGRLLAAGATWDYIIAHPLYSKGLVDVGDVSERLKKLAKCDGQGPVFEEKDILDAIEKSVASGNDELL